MVFFWCSYKHYFKNYNFKLFLLDYGNSVDYFMLRRYSAALPNSLFSSVFFFLSASLGFSTHVTTFPTRKQFYSFFSSLYAPPPAFPALMHWFKHPVKCWGGERRHPCLAFHLRERVFSLSPLRVNCKVTTGSLLSEWARFIVIPSLLSTFMRKKYWMLSSTFSASMKILIRSFSLGC